MPNQSVQVPALDIDAHMLSRHGCKVAPHGVLERRIVANLIAHLELAGFKVHSVNDGDDLHAVTDMKDAMERVFSVDEASLRFYRGGKKGETFDELSNDDWHGVLLVLGNGIDIVSDWNYADGDPDGFNRAMDAFDVEVFA